MASAVAANSGIGNLANAALAAMLGQVADQTVHVSILGPIDQIAALLLDRDETSMGQFFQMEGQGVTRHIELVSQLARRQPFRTGNDQGAKYAQPLVVCQGA